MAPGGGHAGTGNPSPSNNVRTRWSPAVVDQLYGVAPWPTL